MTGLRETELVAAAELYVLQVMLYQGASPRRILGVAPNADRAVIRAHLRDLLNWLHPDKNKSAWHAAFASRVIAAWRQVDRGLDGDERPRGLAGGEPPSARAHRVPWIALPLVASPERSARRSMKGLRIFLAGLTLFSGVTVPDEVTYGVGHALFATTFFDAVPAAPTRAALSGLQ
ncbi:MAG: J domain-containing protein [Roseiarcus sp.]